jgi:hypothetical protein
VPTDDSIDDDVQSHSGAAALQHDTDYITGVPADVQVSAVEVAPDGSVHVVPDVAAATVDTTVGSTELPAEAVAESASTDSGYTSDDDVDMIEQSTVTTTTTDPNLDEHDEPVRETPTTPAAAHTSSKRTASVNSNSGSKSGSGSGNNSNKSGSGSSRSTGSDDSTTGSSGTAGCKLLNDDVVLKFSQEDAPSSNNMLLRRVSCDSAYTMLY